MNGFSTLWTQVPAFRTAVDHCVFAGAVYEDLIDFAWDVRLKYKTVKRPTAEKVWTSVWAIRGFNFM